MISYLNFIRIISGRCLSFTKLLIPKNGKTCAFCRAIHEMWQYLTWGVLWGAALGTFTLRSPPKIGVARALEDD